jgi:hypothetical protein
MAHPSASRIAALAFAIFFSLLAAISLVGAAAMVHRLGLVTATLAPLSFAALNGAMAYGLWRDRRWVTPTLALNLALAVERAWSGGLDAATASAIAATAIALGIVAARRDALSGRLWEIWPILAFAAAQIIPRIV